MSSEPKALLIDPTIGVEAAYAMNWVELMKLMTKNGSLDEEAKWKVYCKVYQQHSRECDSLQNSQDSKSHCYIANQIDGQEGPGYMLHMSAENKEDGENLRITRGPSTAVQQAKY
ncbi:hypothetical protein Tco_1548568 [Tanacetum coccineum]